MENLSKLNQDDSPSMYFSFNTTSGDKTLEAGGDTFWEPQDSTLETQKSTSKTVIKKHVDATPLRAAPKNILQEFKDFSSTPTKMVLRSNSKSNSINGLGIAFLDTPLQKIDAILEEKENILANIDEKAEVKFDEKKISAKLTTRNEENLKGDNLKQTVSATNDQEKFKKTIKTPETIADVEKPLSGNKKDNNKMRYSMKSRKSVLPSEPDLNKNKPTRILNNKRTSLSQPKKQYSSKDIPTALAKILEPPVPVTNTDSVKASVPKISIKKPNSRFSMFAREKPNMKPPRMSIVKTTLNSPANQARKSAARKTLVHFGPRKSMLPIISRKSVLLPKESPHTETKTAQASKPNFLKPKHPLLGTSPEEFVCNVCSRKFRVLSLFESHKKSHNTNASSSTENKCRFCDKKFAIAKALSNHLSENCMKIPAAEKKKLLFPSINSNFVQNKIAASQKTLSRLPSTISSTESIDSMKNGAECMPPPSSSKVKKTPHSGIY